MKSVVAVMGALCAILCGNTSALAASAADILIGSGQKTAESNVDAEQKKRLVDIDAAKMKEKVDRQIADNNARLDSLAKELDQEDVHLASATELHQDGLMSEKAFTVEVNSIARHKKACQNAIDKLTAENTKLEIQKSNIDPDADSKKAAIDARTQAAQQSSWVRTGGNILERTIRALSK